jgi:hypothetical protein
MPRLNCLADPFSWMSFRNRDKLDFIHCASSFHCGLRDLFANTLKIFSDLHQLRL